MKPKPTRHQATNTHTFKGFGLKVQELRVSARKYLLKRNSNDEEEGGTHIAQTITKWKELNLTQAYHDFLRELGNDVQTVVQLVHRENEVASILKTHLSKVSSPALKPLLDCLIAFAADLSQEFYMNHLYDFLTVLIGQLKTKNSDQIEAVFMCIVSLFIILAKYLKDDLFKLYHEHNYAKLLSKSYPWYINELAAQSLSFLLRKLPKRDVFLGLALRKLKKDDDQCEGVGRMLAAMMKSDIAQRLHSSTAQTLTFLLDLLGEDDIPVENAVRSISFAMNLLGQHVTNRSKADSGEGWQDFWKDDSELVWPVLWKHLHKLQQKQEKDGVLNAVLQVIETLVGHRSAALVVDGTEALTEFTTIINTELPDTVFTTITKIIAGIITSPHHNVPHSQLQQCVAAVYNDKSSHHIILDYSKQVLSFGRFESEILPHLLRYLNALISNATEKSVCMDALELLVFIVITKQPLCTTGIDRNTWRKYSLDCSLILNVNDKKSLPSQIEQVLNQGLDEDFNNIEEVIMCLICLPHIAPIDYLELTPQLMWLLNDTIERLADKTEKTIEILEMAVNKRQKLNKEAEFEQKEDKNAELDLNIKYEIDDTTKKSFFLVSVLVEVLSYILTAEDFLSSLSQMELLNVLKEKPQYRENVDLLRALDMHLTVANEEENLEIMNEDILKQVYDIVAPALSSSNHQVRLLVTHILSLFPVVLPPTPENVEPVESMFSIMLRAECVPVTPWQYRERLRYLTMLSADHVALHTPVSRCFTEAPLLFFMGQLYINFKDMWDPCLKFIASYAHSLKQELFWRLWFTKLQLSCHATQLELYGETQNADEPLNFQCSIIVDLSQKLSKHAGFRKVPSQPDVMNYRDLLWRAMALFPDVCEAKSRDIAPIFINFLEKELFPVDYTVAPTQDVSRKAHNLSIANITVEDDDENAEDISDMNELSKEPSKELQDVDNGGNEDADEEDARIRMRKAPMKSLCVHLTLLSKMHNPKAFYLSPKLELFYLEFLSHPHTKVQRLALDCMFTYNYPHFTPYKEHLYKIIDDRTFKNTLTLFSVDDSGEEIILQEKHRTDFMPILMRILFGKMHNKTGHNTSGKNKVAVRKAVVLRFLAGAKESELDTFLDLAFELFISHLDGSALDVVTRVLNNRDFTKVVPLKRLQGGLTTLQNIISKIGNLLKDQLPYLLKILLFIISSATVLLENRSEVRESCRNALKNLRQASVQQLVVFFTMFVNYPWSQDEITAVFQAAVWPTLARLPDEGIYTPTPIMQLFMIWAEYPRYFPLLAVHHSDDSTMTPLPYVVRLLCHSKCSETVRSSILNMTEHLLTYKDYSQIPDEDEDDGRERGPPIICQQQVSVEASWSRDGSILQNYGTALLMPHLDGVLQCMKTMVSKLKLNQTVSKRDLTILTQLTEWASSKAICEDLLNLAIPLVVKGTIKNDEKVTKLLETCVHLLLVVDNAGQYVIQLLTLFGSVENRFSRAALCQVLDAISSTCTEYKDLAEVASSLNSWNNKMVDEVDFERRLACYKGLTQTLGNMNSLDLPLCLLLVFNNLFFVKNQEDSSLRELAVHCLKQLVDALGRLHDTNIKAFKTIVEGTLLPQIRRGLREKKETAREDYINILSFVVIKLHPYVSRLRDLYKLVNEEEEEADFYTCMCHIQRHRRGRAMTQLADKLSSGELTFHTDTLTEYLLPMVSVFLFKEAYAKDDVLLSNSIKCIGAISAKLPWYPYLSVLRFYISVMEREKLDQVKLAVRALDAVLNAFHEEVEEMDLTEEDEDGYDITNGKSTQQKGSKILDKPVIKSDNDLKEKPQNDVGKESNENLEEPEDMEIVNEDKENLDEVSVKLTKAQKVYRTLVKSIVPQLQKTLSDSTETEKKHKKNKKRVFAEDGDIKRIPLAFALVKLLKKLPKKILDTNVNGVLMKMVTFLKSQAKSIRDEARQMLVQIMLELGGGYLPWLVRDMHVLLTKGFQAHVLIFTLHAVLIKMKGLLKSDHVDPCLDVIINICKEDLLGTTAEEKQVGKIIAKVKEAKGDKSYSIVAVVAEFISVGCVKELIVPLRDVLAQTQDKKVVIKITRCLKEIARGLENNAGITVEQKTIFIYGILTERLKELTVSDGKKKVIKKAQVVDCYILAPEPKRAGALAPKTSLKASVHVFVEFALQLLYGLMRREKLSVRNPEHHVLIDPFVPLMKDCINSEYPEVSFQALHCIGWFIKFPLPTLKEHISLISSQMFVILHKFSSAELTKGKLFDLVQMTFRCLSMVIKTVSYYIVSEEQVEVLLQYVQDTLEDINQQQTAFTLLHSIVGRKIYTSDLDDILEKVKEMSITSTKTHMLDQARRTYYTYLLTYPIKPRRVTEIMLYYLGNIAYPLLDGRLSAIIMITEMISNFPNKLFDKKIETSMWFKLSEQIVKEDATESRELLHKALTALWQRSPRRDMLLDLSLKLLQEAPKSNVVENAVAVQLSASALSAFLDAPKEQLNISLVNKIAPLLIKQLDPEILNPVSEVADEGFEDVNMNVEVCELDGAMVALLEVFTKLRDIFFNHPDWSTHFPDIIWSHIQAHLLYPHLQVRSMCSGLIGHLLAAHPVEKGESPCLAETQKTARSLALDLAEQLRTKAPSGTPQLTRLALSVVRNLIYIIRHSSLVSLNISKEKIEGVNEEVESNPENPLIQASVWILHHVGNMAYDELRLQGKESTVVREAMLNLLAGIVVLVGKDDMSPVLFNYVIKHLARELSDESLPEALASRTKEVSGVVRDVVGLEMYTQHLTLAQSALTKKKWAKKAQVHAIRATNPELSQKRKMKKREDTKNAKRQKIDERKGNHLKKKLQGKKKLIDHAIIHTEGI